MSTAIMDNNASVGIGLSIDDLVATDGTMAPPAAAAAPIKKKAAPRKKATPVVPETQPVADDADGIDGDAPTTPLDATAAPKKKAAPRKKAVAVVPKTEPAADGVDGADGMDVDAPVTPPAKKTPAKRKPKAKAAPQTPSIGEDGEPVVAATPVKSTAKRAATKAPDGETPTKKPRATPAKSAGASKAGANKGPTCWEEFSEEEKLIINMRRNKSTWTEVDLEIEKLTGVKPGKDVTRKRFGKLEAVATVFAESDMAKLAAAKLTVDAAIEELIKKAAADRWSKVADQIKSLEGGEYKPAVLEKKYEMMVSQGQIKNGIYVVADEGGSASNGDSNKVANGDNDSAGTDEMMIDAEEKET